MTERQAGDEARGQIYDAARARGHLPPAFNCIGVRPMSTGPRNCTTIWLEKRITSGRVGSGLRAAAFLRAVARWLLPGGIHGRRFVVLLWLALKDRLNQARFDFPFQV